MQTRHRLGEYVLDVQRHTLHRGGQEIHLGERAFGVLRLLVENAGRVVTRNELIDAVWRDVVVSDDSLARAVSDLRTALQDDASHARYIRTVHRQGYVFIAPVTPVDDAESEIASIPETPADKPWWLRPSFAIVVLAVVVMVSVFALRELTRSSDDADSMQPNFATWRLRALGPHPFTSSAIKPAFAKSDNLLAVVSPDPETEEHSIFLLRPEGGEPLQLTHGIEVRGPSPEFTADDSHIIFTTYHSDPGLGMVPEVWQVPVPAGEPTLLVKSASAASTSPDDRALVYAAVSESGTSIRVREPDGTELEVAARGFWPRWSPNGEWIAYTTSDPEGGNGTIHVVRPDGSERCALSTISSQVYGLCWTPDSSNVIFASEQGGTTALWMVDLRSRSQKSVTRGPGICTSPTMAADGRRLVFDFSHRRWYLYVASEVGEEARRVLVEPGVQAAALSPDGSRIAVAVGTEAQSPAVSVLDLDTMERRTLSGMTASAVAWTPGAEDLLVAAPAPDETSHWIWSLPLSGGLPRPVLKGAGRWDAPRPSPDGTMLAAVRISPAGSELIVHHLDRDESRTVARKSVIFAPRWSPDGRFLAWSGNWRPDDLESGGVWVCPVEGGDPRRLTANGALPLWEGDGGHLLFARFIEHEGIWRVPLAGGSPRLVRRLQDDMPDLYLHGLDAGRGGSPVMFFSYEYTGELYVLEPPVD
jgi:Tol biopolymer transport system component/DNA-binding winged helix-turn-helix (wHTH) protein